MERKVYKWFKQSEFDSPDLEGSGEMMEDGFMNMLDLARDIYGHPMIITSGFRTVAYNKSLRDKGQSASQNSSHLLGWAADIRCTNSRQRFLMIESFLDAGFSRIGIGKDFIHVDCDPEKDNAVIWTY